jgi:hypothetical protein
MSISYIPDHVRLRLWGKAAGRCEYEGCNDRLWIDPLTQWEFNAAYIAHIYADSPNGPRYDAAKSEELKADLANLMLLCDVHHRLIDHGDVAGHPVERLLAMKAKHEDRVELVGNIQPELRTEIVLYCANIGAHDAPVTFGQAAQAVVPARYPASAKGVGIGLKNSLLADRDDVFWTAEIEQLERGYDRDVRPRASDGMHFSLFAVGPQPLLTLLGSLLSDLHGVDVYQLHREPVRTWAWAPDESSPDSEFVLDIVPPAERERHERVAIVFGMSAALDHKRIHDVLGSKVSIWTLQLRAPHNDALRTRRQLGQFRAKCRELLSRINTEHPGLDELNVFPAMPVAAAVELGRVRMPKADPPLVIYDEDRSLGGFRRALRIPTEKR